MAGIHYYFLKFGCFIFSCTKMLFTKCEQAKHMSLFYEYLHTLENRFPLSSNLCFYISYIALFLHLTTN